MLAYKIEAIICKYLVFETNFNRMEIIFYTARATLFTVIVSLLLFGCAQNTAGLKDSAIPDEKSLYSEIIQNPNSTIDSFDDRFTNDTHNHQNDQTGLESKPKFEYLWPRIISLFALPTIRNKRVLQELQWYLNHPDYLQRVQLRAEPYLFEIVEQLEKQGLPGELAFLPIVESAFKPHARSHARAHGIWQFIPSTGRLYGLKQNWWYDGRRDIYASTQAAIRYLQKLNREFKGDWLLALAAYNCGEGTIHKAIRKNARRHRPTNFWALRLPRETRSYVPRLLAVSRIFANAKQYHLALRPIQNRPVLERVHIGSQLDMAVAAKLAGISIEKLYHYNPGYNQWATDPSGPHRLMIPTEQSNAFKTTLAGLPDEKRIKLKRHIVKPGESLNSVAHAYNTTTEIIKQTNRLKGNSLHVGRQLIVPIASKALSNYNLNPNLGLAYSSRGRKSRSRKIYYKVRRGDNLWTIAKRHSVSVKSLAKWNHMAARKTLRPGKKLVIFRNHSRSYAKSRNKRSRRYTVRKGDSLYLIARRFRVTVADLRKWNAANIGKYIRPGQRLKIGPTT